MHDAQVPGRPLMIPGLLLFTAAPFLGGCQNLPEPKVSQRAVFAAAEEVVAQRYPMYAVSRESGFVYAVSPVEMNGGSKTKKQISVLATRNLTGSYAPQVRVLRYVEIGTPSTGANPESASANYLATPVDANRWQALDYLRYEEQAIYDEIMQRL